MKHSASQPSYDDFASWKRVFRAMPHHAQPPTNPPVSEDWHSVGGIDLHIDRWDTPYATARAILIHGAGTYGRLLGPFGWHLSLHGIETVIPDLPGYGLTQVQPRQTLSYDDWRECIQSLIEQESARSHLPLYLIGFSTGGMLAYEAAALSNSIHGLVTTSLVDPTRYGYRSPVRLPFISHLFKPLIVPKTSDEDGLGVAKSFTGQVDGMTTSHHVCAEIWEDELVGGRGLPREFIESWMASPPVVPPESFRSCPVFLAYPAADQWASFELSKSFYDRLGVTKRLSVLEQGGHLPVESKAFYQMDSAVSNFILSLSAGHPLEPSLL